MKIQYFQGTDTLYIELRACDVDETRDFDENTLIDVDEYGEICALTIEHARARADVPYFSFGQIGGERLVATR
ncbi:MAG: DUF2283 domain-containing protein [Acidithiobacillus sp.]